MSAFLPPLRLAAALAFCSAVAQAAPGTAQRHPCGTARLFETGGETGGASGATAGSARIAGTSKAAALSLWGRVLQTPHFAVHYTVGRNIHQPVLTAADAFLKAKRDSLHTVFLSLSGARRDSAVNAALDGMGAPHPVFIQNAAAYFENAWSYYGDTLDMRMPDSNLTEYFHKPVRGKMNVEIGDIQDLHGDNGTYGITLPPESLGYSANVVVDNDFLFNANINTNTWVVTGTPITVYSGDSLLHNYNVDWDAGLAVTIAHEFYHAVQFAYTPLITGGYHSWYELSAVGMEERLAGGVNDYLGYLSAVLRPDSPASLLTFGGNENYGNGIFHIFLSHHLGKAFDVPVWERLRTHQNNLPAALLHVLGGQSQARWDSLFSAYAGSLAIAGLPGSNSSPLAFSPDFARWVRPKMDSAPASGSSSLSMRPLSYRLVKPVAAAPTWASFKGMAGARLVAQNGSSFSSTFLRDSTLPVIDNGTLALAVSNGSFSSTRTLTLFKGASSSSTTLTAFPNPAPRSADGIHFTAFAAGSNASLIVVSESGRRVATLTAAPTGSLWNWNFRDGQNRALPPGVYYYGRIGDTPQTLLVLP